MEQKLVSETIGHGALNYDHFQEYLVDSWVIKSFKIIGDNEGGYIVALLERE
jgi:hypothetical protein